MGLLFAISGALLCVCAAAAQKPPPRPLGIVTVLLHQFEDGPPVAAAEPFQPGDTVFLSFQVAGYRASESRRIHLTYRIEAADPAGVALAEPVADAIATELAPQDKDWLPKVRYSVLVPPWAGSGSYRLRARVRDELAGADVTHDRNFTVRGRQVEPSPTLVVKNFRFFRSEEAAEPMPVAAYRPGDTLWARFDITGYRLADKNRYHVEYGIAVLRANGETLYAEPKAAEEQDSTFYPKRYVPGALSLNLQTELARGDYTIVVTARDRVGGETAESRQVFHVE